MTRDDKQGRPSVPDLLWRLVTHIVRDTLGIDTIRRSTQVGAVLTALAGLPLIGSAIEGLMGAVIAWLGGTRGALWEPVWTFGVLATVFAVLLWGTLSQWRTDLQLDELGQIEGHTGPAEAQRALLLPCSLPPARAWLASLAPLSPEARLRAIRAPPAPGSRWVELLVRALEVHRTRVERVVLLIDPVRYRSPELQDALVGLVKAVIIGDGGPREPPEVRLAPIGDVNDAEAVRALASAELHRLIEVGLTAQEIAIQITTGTTATSVGLALAATVHRVEVQYFPQFGADTPPPDHPGVGPLCGVPGLRPVRIDTDQARRRLQAAMF